MKMKAVQALLNSEKRVILFQGQEQWIGDGNAAYPLHGLPPLKQENLKAFLDCNEKQWEKFYVQEDEASFSIEDNILEEEDLEYIGLTIRYMERELVPLIGAGHIYFVQTKYIKPLIEDISFHLRKTFKEQPYIAVKEGFLLRAVIMPCECVDEQFCNIIGNLYVNCNNEFKYQIDMQQAMEECEKYSKLLFEEEET